MSGKFQGMLLRNNKQLREDRGKIIVNGAEKNYRRAVEDLKEEIDTLTIDRDNLLDVNPGNTQTIINPSDFNIKDFVERDLEMGIKLANLEIKLGIAQKRYDELFADVLADQLEAVG